MRILVTGFEPFAGLSHNPSQALLALLPPRMGRAGLVTACLPVDTQQAPRALEALYQTRTIHLPPDETLALYRPQAYVPLQTQTQAVLLALETTALPA